MNSILSNELKKGTKIVMSGTGWSGTILDNKKGNIRMAEIVGYYTDIGSIYVHNIAYAIIDDKHVTIELTEKQKELKNLVDNFNL